MNTTISYYTYSFYPGFGMKYGPSIPLQIDPDIPPLTVQASLNPGTPIEASLSLGTPVLYQGLIIGAAGSVITPNLDITTNAG